MKPKFYIIFFLSLCIISCHSQETKRSSVRPIEIAARNESHTLNKPLIYRVKVPTLWNVQTPGADVSLFDTTKPISEFYITEGQEKIRITIHNFPADSIEKRIPPMAQINRWKRQFKSIDPNTESIKAQSFGGYYGWLFEATGLLEGSKSTMMGWTLQLASEHFRSLQRSTSRALEERYRQMRGDVTIKAVGPENLIKKHRDDIIQFARSFQLIDDIT